MIGSVRGLDYVVIPYRYREAGAFPRLSGAISPHSSASGTILRVNKVMYTASPFSGQVLVENGTKVIVCLSMHHPCCVRCTSNVAMGVKLV